MQKMKFIVLIASIVCLIFLSINLTSNTGTIVIKRKGRGVTKIYPNGDWKTQCDNMTADSCSITVAITPAN